jgi:SAM-dependent methyltransferase
LHQRTQVQLSDAQTAETTRFAESVRRSDEQLKILADVNGTLGGLPAEQRRLRREQEQLRREQEQLCQDQRHLRDAQTAILEEQRRTAFEQTRYLDQLRRLGAASLGALKPAAPQAPARSAAPDDGCRVCGGRLAYKWSCQVLNDRHTAEYHECTACGTLQVPNPAWLDEAYAGEGGPSYWNPDPGRFVRNFSVYCYLRSIHESGLLPAKPRWLDFGGGNGLLTQMFKNAGHDAWMADPYVACPIFAPERLIPDLAEVPPASFDVVMAFEVLEHLTDPAKLLDSLRRVLRPDGLMVFSTAIYEPGKHGPDWHYLSTAAGQHVTFWTREAFRRLAGRHGFRSVGYYPDPNNFCVVLAPCGSDDLDRRLEAARAALTAPEFLERATREWELTRGGGLPAPTVRVEAATEERGLRCAS